MAITVNNPPGWYAGTVGVSVSVSGDIRKMLVSRVEKPPVLSEVLAYDKGTIPGSQNPSAIVDRPYISVTQDGRGNVVYDGGFPKFYDGTTMGTNVVNGPGGSIESFDWLPEPTTFNELSGQMKYFYNVINFIMNPSKVAKGNRKILIVCNTTDYGIYSIRQGRGGLGSEVHNSNTYCGFYGNLKIIERLTNTQFTFYNTTDAGGPIDLNYTYLDQYAAVVFMCTCWTRHPSSTNLPNNPLTQITDKFAQELSTYRSNGNGLYIVTDHMQTWYNNVEEALLSEGFAYDANKVARYYNAYFSGNVDRDPMLVSEIRQQLIAAGGNGQHPLFDNLPDDSYIYNGASESITVVEDISKYLVTPPRDVAYTLSTAGWNYINVLLQYTDGTIETRPMKYMLTNPNEFSTVTTAGRSTGVTWQTRKRAFDFKLVWSNPTTTLTGVIVKNGDPFATFTYTDKLNITPMFNGGIKFLVEDIIGYHILLPFEYQMNVRIVDAPITGWLRSTMQLGQYIKTCTTLTPEWAGWTFDQINNDINNLADYAGVDYDKTYTRVTNDWWWMMKHHRTVIQSTTAPGKIQLWVAANPTEWNTTKPASIANTLAIIASTNKVMRFIDGAWVEYKQAASVFFSPGRKIDALNNTKKWICTDTAVVLDT